MEVQVREARLTDIDRVRGLIERADERWTTAELSNAADLLRQLVYLPNAGIFVAVDGREVVGAAVLSLRPSVAAGGLVGSIDLLAVEPGHEHSGVSEALIKELVRSAGNKGCVEIEAVLAEESLDAPRWEALGFSEARPRLSRPLAGLRAGVR